MKRLISGMEAAQAGISPGFEGVPLFGGRVSIAALRGLADRDAYRLWRSLPGYRKACRMLRRSGRRVRRGHVRVSWVSLPAVVTGLEEIGVQAYRSVLDDPEAKTFADGSVYDLIDGDLRRALASGALG